MQFVALVALVKCLWAKRRWINHHFQYFCDNYHSLWDLEIFAWTTHDDRTNYLRLYICAQGDNKQHDNVLWVLGNNTLPSLLSNKSHNYALNYMYVHVYADVQLHNYMYNVFAGRHLHCSNQSKLPGTGGVWVIVGIVLQLFTYGA